MNRMGTVLRRAMMTGLFLLLGQLCGRAFYAGPSSELENFDKRLEMLSKTEQPDRSKAVSEFKNNLPEAKVSLDAVLQTPKWIGATHNFLTGPKGQGRGIKSKTLAQFPADDTNRATKAFVLEHKSLFGHGPE